MKNLSLIAAAILTISTIGVGCNSPQKPEEPVIPIPTPEDTTIEGETPVDKQTNAFQVLQAGSRVQHIEAYKGEYIYTHFNPNLRVSDRSIVIKTEKADYFNIKSEDANIAEATNRGIKCYNIGATLIKITTDGSEPIYIGIRVNEFPKSTNLYLGSKKEVFVAGGGFNSMKGWKKTVIKKMTQENTLFEYDTDNTKTKAYLFKSKNGLKPEQQPVFPIWSYEIETVVKYIMGQKRLQKGEFDKVKKDLLKEFAFIHDYTEGETLARHQGQTVKVNYVSGTSTDGYLKATVICYPDNYIIFIIHEASTNVI